MVPNYFDCGAGAPGRQKRGKNGGRSKGKGKGESCGYGASPLGATSDKSSVRLLGGEKKVRWGEKGHNDEEKGKKLGVRGN